MQTTITKSSQAQTASAIRTELKNKFPNTKFRVRSESFSMGNSVDIEWTDGPTYDMIDEITRKYQYGHFDGMTDMYEHSNSREDIPQAKYVMPHREMSEETKQAIIKKHNSEWCEAGQIKELNAWNEDAQCWNQDLVYRKFRKLDLSGVKK